MSVILEKGSLRWDPEAQGTGEEEWVGREQWEVLDS